MDSSKGRQIAFEACPLVEVPPLPLTLNGSVRDADGVAFLEDESGCGSVFIWGMAYGAAEAAMWSHDVWQRCNSPSPRRPPGDHSTASDLQPSRLDSSNGRPLSKNALRVVSHALVAGWVVEHPGTHGGFSGACSGNVQDSRLGQLTSEPRPQVPRRGLSCLCRARVRCDELCGLYLGRDQQLCAGHSRRY